MRRIIVCGPPHSGKSVFLANLMRRLPPDSFYLAFAAPDGEWHWSNFGDQDLVAAVRQKGKFTPDFVSTMKECITANEQPLVLVDTGGKRLEPNEWIFGACDGCIILSSSPEEITAWREFAHQWGKPGFVVIAELDSVLHGTNELYPDQGDGAIRGRVAGLERGTAVASEVIDAVAERLRDIIRVNSAEMSDGELLCNVNGAVVVDRLIPETEQSDPFLGVRPQHLRPALRLVGAVAKLPVVRIWNVRAAILASAIAARVPGEVQLYDVARGYVSLPDAMPQGAGFCPGIEWEVLPLPDFTLVKWHNSRFITAEDVAELIPPAVDYTRPVVIANDGPPMWVHASLVRAYARAGVPWVGQFWPVESGRTQPSLGGKLWSKAYPFAGPAVIVAGPDERIGEMFPISFDLLRWGTPVMGHLGSGELVIDRKDSHVATHPTALPIVAEALSQISSEKRENAVEEIDLGRVIGENIRVSTTDADRVVYAQRTGREGLTRFIKDRAPEPCESMVIVLRRATNGAYVLITAFIGTKCPAEPWDRWAIPESVPFWNTHALIWGEEEVIPGTETSECPWDK